MKMLAIRMGNHPIHLLPYPKSILTLLPYPANINQLLNLIFILSLAFSYSNYAPLHPYVLKYPSLAIENGVSSNQEVKHSPHILELGLSNNTKTKT